MYGLLRFIGRYGAVLLFIFFELIAFYLVVNYNQGQRKIFLFSANAISGEILNRYTGFMEYLKLDEVADSLAAENAVLYRKLQTSTNGYYTNPTSPDTIYELTPARVVSNSVSQRNNILTIDKGARDGIIPGQGVRGRYGPVGVVRHVGKSYSTVQSILHTQTMLSVRLRNRNGFGSLVWRGSNPTRLSVEAMPKHVEVSVGDTMETSGYSYLFPAGIMVGIVEKARVPPGSNFYEIDLKLAYDMSKLSFVYIYLNKDKPQIDSLLNLTDE